MQVRNTLLVARATPPSEAYCAAANLLGLTIWHRSMLIIKACDPSVLRPQLARLAAANPTPTLVFCSPFAAGVLQSLAPALLREHVLMSVGAGTSAALAPFSATAPVISEGAQALLDILPNSLTGQSFCLFQASDGLPVLKAGLYSRGAQVQTIEPYTRITSPMLEQERERLQILRCVDVGSGSQLEALLESGLPLSTPLILPSERVKKLAESLGFADQLISSNSSEIERLGNLSELLQ